VVYEKRAPAVFCGNLVHPEVTLEKEGQLNKNGDFIQGCWVDAACIINY